MVHEALGPFFTLLALDAPDDIVSAFEHEAAARSVPLAIIRDTRADERARYGASLILVRPDGFVACAGDDLQPDDALDRATGHDPQ